MPIEYFDDEQAASLISRLLRLTFHDKLNWSKVGDTSYMFGAAAGKSYFFISSRDEDDLAPHALEITQSSGDKLQELQTLESQQLENETARDLADLYAAAKRKALRLEGVVDEIFKELDGLDTDES